MSGPVSKAAFQKAASSSRGTPPDAPAVRKLLDVVAWRTPTGDSYLDEFAYAMFEWAEEVTRIVEGFADIARSMGDSASKTEALR